MCSLNFAGYWLIIFIVSEGMMQCLKRLPPVSLTLWNAPVEARRLYRSLLQLSNLESPQAASLSSSAIRNPSRTLARQFCTSETALLCPSAHSNNFNSADYD